MDTKMDTFFEFTIDNSKKHRIITITLHCLALLACMLNALPELYRYTLGSVVLASSYYYCNIGKMPECRIRYSKKTGWSVCYANDNYCTLNMASSTVISQYLTVMHFYIGKQRKSLLLFNDSLADHAYRRFSVLLKTSGYQQK